MPSPCSGPAVTLPTHSQLRHAMVFVCTVLGQTDLGSCWGFCSPKGILPSVSLSCCSGHTSAGTVSSPMSGCCNGRCHVPHIGAAVPPASGTVGPLPGPAFLAMLIPWTWCCQQGIYIELASRTYSNYILCASISVCGIWIFCHLCRELNANNALRPALSFLGRRQPVAVRLCTIWMCLPVPSGKRPPSVHAALPHRVGHPAFPAAAWLLDIAAHRLAQADRKINSLNRSASPVPGLQGGFCLAALLHSANMFYRGLWYNELSISMYRGFP